MNNQFSTVFKTLLIIMFSCSMIAHHWSWDEACDREGNTGGVSMNFNEVVDADADGHSYTFGQGLFMSCVKDNNTDNRAYLAFYIITLIVSLAGTCCLICEKAEAAFGGFLMLLLVWYFIMEGLRVQSFHSELLDMFEDGYDNDAVRVFLSFYVAQFCLYCSLLGGLAFELFNIPCCHCACVQTVVVKRKAIIEV